MIQYVSPYIVCLPPRIHVVLGLNLIAVASVEKLTQSLYTSHNPHSSPLWLRCNYIGAPGVKALADALALVPDLTILDLGCVSVANIQLALICSHDFSDLLLDNHSQHCHRILLLCDTGPVSLTLLPGKYCFLPRLPDNHVTELQD